MRFDVVTLFPELFAPHLAQGITRRAFEPADASAPPLVEVRLWPLRDFAEDAYRRVDDRPYGGGPGMVLLAEPLQRALSAVRAARPVAGPVVLFTPAGRRLEQSLVTRLAGEPGAILVCGRYEGIDQRFIDTEVDLELSLGDFVLSGGELPALALLDAVARLQPGVLGDARSHAEDSFSEGLLEGPHYTRPEALPTRAGTLGVPAPLLSGHHAGIARWRRERALELTLTRRPDLVEAARAAGRLSAADERFLASLRL